MFHGGSYFVCADRSEVAAFAWQLNAPTTVNTGRENIACEQFDGAGCLNNSGVKGDGQVTIETDWGNPTIVGCPDVSGVKQRVAGMVQCVDGTGILFSLGGAQVDIFGAYVLESAHPETTDPLIADSRAGRPRISNATNNADGTTTLDLTFPTALKVYTDCDAGSFGRANNVCTDEYVPTATVGRIFTSIQPCQLADGTNLPPDPNRSLWTVSSATADASGRAVVTATRPTVAGSCLFVGATTILSTFETAAITGFVAVGGPASASPMALDVMAEQAAGNVRIRWRTDQEIGLAGFNILAEGRQGSGRVNDTLIPATGNGGRASYEQFVPRGKFQGNRTVIIESVMTDGSTLRSAPAKF
jgi:hypothetical protein